MKSAIETLIENRRPFVVTSDYIGPDRRTSPRETETSPVEKIRVPNKLRHTATGDDGGINAAAIQNAVQEQRIERYVNKVLVTTEKISTISEENKSKLPGLLVQLSEVTELLDRRITSSRFNHQGFLNRF